jgi:hypothetical protein
MRCLPLLGVIAVLALLPGCVEPVLADGASVVGTDKTLVDHAISLYKKKNCSSVRKEQGLTYCVEDEPNPAPNVHCYPTLGAPDCFAAPDPYLGQQKIGQNNRLTRR